MSLQVWLPLTKDTKNQGLVNIVSNNNAVTFTNGGKLGEKYFSAGTITIPASYSSSIFNGTHISFSFWLKPIGTDGTSVIFGQSSMNVGNNRMYSIFQYPTPNDLHISWQSETSSSTFVTFTRTGFFEANKWTHCALVYDGSKVLVYKNGVLNSTYDGVNTRTAFNYDYPINASSIRCLNDVRIYDHCLSPMEVKELAKGLVLHYPLNRGGWGQENLVPKSYLGSNCVTIDSPNSICKYGYIIPLSSSDNNAVVRQSNALTNLGCWALGDTYTVSFTAWSEGNTGLSCDIFPDTYGTSMGMPNDVSTTNCTTTPKRYIFSGALTNSSSSLVDLYLRFWRYGRLGNYIIYITDIKIERGSIATPWCPNSSDTLATTMGLNSTIEYDCSGFCNNGTRIGTFTWTSDTPKYQVSTVFSGSQRIEAPWNPSGTTSFTIAGWFYNSSGTTYYGAKNTYNTYICLEQSRYFVYNSGASAYVGNYTSVRNTWQHITLVHDASTTKLKLYINGSFVSEVTTNGTIYNSDILDIGGRQGAAQYNGKISDFRIYATALSADDVKSLYQNCATIDPDGTIRGQIRS